VLVINQLDVTILISLFTLYKFRTILVHHQEFRYVRDVGLTKVCGALVWYPLCGPIGQVLASLVSNDELHIMYTETRMCALSKFDKALQTGS
jgi:hypothetical protein